MATLGSDASRTLGLSGCRPDRFESENAMHRCAMRAAITGHYLLASFPGAGRKTTVLLHGHSGLDPRRQFAESTRRRHSPASTSSLSLNALLRKGGSSSCHGFVVSFTAERSVRHKFNHFRAAHKFVTARAAMSSR